jgi:hypothetical protein
MYTVHKEFLKQVPGNISPAGEYPAEEFIMKSPVFQRLPVVHVRVGNDKVENFSPVVDDGMQPETEKPSRRTFSFGSYHFEGLMAVFTFDVTDAKRSGVNEKYAGTFARAAQLQEKRHFHDRFCCSSTKRL